MTKFATVTDDQHKGAGMKVPHSIVRQVYESDPRPKGVEVIKLPSFADGQGGHFLELLRLDGQGCVEALKDKGINLQPKQMNFSYVAKGTERFGHLHPDQDELWIVGNGQLILGVIDFREGSETYEVQTKFVLSAGMGVFVPAGVAHSLANYGTLDVSLVYAPSMHFSAGEDTQEWRINEDTLWDFMKPEKI